MSATLGSILSVADNDRLYVIFAATVMACQCREPEPGTVILHLKDVHGNRLPDVEAEILALYHRVREDPPELVEFLLTLTLAEMSRRGIHPPVMIQSAIALPFNPEHVH